ncbi:hypothetical protein HMPREF9120_00842 [Neisseria sp. oral taxon 020 str. F0370]|nr:hypothetical protein HMPREF9120_00842 [Neisseria sp. oral taxon 020 str. F0370]
MFVCPYLSPASNRKTPSRFAGQRHRDRLKTELQTKRQISSVNQERPSENPNRIFRRPLVLPNLPIREFPPAPSGITPPAGWAGQGVSVLNRASRNSKECRDEAFFPDRLRPGAGRLSARRAGAGCSACRSKCRIRRRKRGHARRANRARRNCRAQAA